MLTIGKKIQFQARPKCSIVILHSTNFKKLAPRGSHWEKTPLYHLDVELMDIADIQALGDKVLRQLNYSVMLLMPKG